MSRLPFPMTLLALGCAALGCAHTQAPSAAPAPSAPQRSAAEPSQDPPELIAVRVLVVAYEGAQGAASDQKRTRAQAQERADMLANMARGADPLVQLVPKYSDAAGAAETMGVLRVRPAQPAPLSADAAQAALSLPVGAVSAPIETPAGFLVIERLKDPPAGPDRIHAKHILIGYAGSPQSVTGATRSESEARTLAEQIAAQAKQPDADWDALAAQHTDEAAGKSTGGDLGSFGRGQMVPDFERAAFALKIGEISAVVQSPFGFHIIKRVD